MVRHIYATQGDDTEILFGPDMWLGAYVERETGRPMHVWDGECHVHAGIRPSDIEAVRRSNPGAELLIHPECGCTTSVMEYVASGDIDSEGVHMLSTGGMLSYAEQAERSGGPARAVVATEVGMLYPLQMAAPDVEFIPANAEASCRYMKMITLPKLRDALRDLKFEVSVPADIASPRTGADRSHGRDRLSLVPLRRSRRRFGRRRGGGSGRSPWCLLGGCLSCSRWR